MQKQILNQSKPIPLGYTLKKDLIKKIILQVLRERRQAAVQNIGYVYTYFCL